MSRSEQVSSRLRKDVDYTSKPSTFDEVTDFVSLTDHEMNTLRVYDNIPSPFEGHGVDDILFIVAVNGKRYLVNTEGFPYCRYVSEIVD